MATNLPKSQQEQGTRRAHYEELGPYHCKDCVHKIHMNVPICIHPEIVADPELKDKRCYCDNAATNFVGVFVDLEKGCCGYVKQEAKQIVTLNEGRRGANQ